MPYEIVELGVSDEPIGYVNFDSIEENRGIQRYWHKTLDTKVRTKTVWLSEAQRVYRLIKEKYPNNQFEIRDI